MTSSNPVGIGAHIRYRRPSNGTYADAIIADRVDGLWVLDDEYADPITDHEIRFVYHPGKVWNDAWTFEARYTPEERDAFMHLAPFTYVNRRLQAG